MSVSVDSAGVDRRGLATLVGGAAGCAAAFALVTLAVATGWRATGALDDTWSSMAFSFTLQHQWTQAIARAVTWTANTSTLTVLTVCVVLACVLARRFTLATWLAVTVAGSAALNSAVKAGMERPRPPTVGILASAHGFAFPSGHAQGAAATYTAIVLVVGWQVLTPGRRMRVISATAVVLLVAAVGASRVLLGVHWPTDVLGGWLLGSAWVLAAAAVALRWLVPPVPATQLG